MTEPLAYTIDAAAQAAGIGRTTLYSLIGEGKIEARKSGGRTLIPAVSLRAYLDSLPPATITTGATRRARLAALA